MSSSRVPLFHQAPNISIEWRWRCWSLSKLGVVRVNTRPSPWLRRSSSKLGGLPPLFYRSTARLPPRLPGASTYFPLPFKPRIPLRFFRKGMQRYRERVSGTMQKILPSTNCSWISQYWYLRWLVGKIYSGLFWRFGQRRRQQNFSWPTQKSSCPSIQRENPRYMALFLYSSNT